jgi:hypothetical protein
MYVYGDFVQGFVRGFDWGLGTGFVLEDHPHRRTKPQEAPGTGGSAGIPDSLGHKPVCTSGAAWSSVLPTVVSFAEFRSPWRVIVPANALFLCFAMRLIITRIGKLATSPSRVRPDLRNHKHSHPAALAERRPTHDPEMAPPAHVKKSHEIGAVNLLPFRLDRATFDVSPGNGKTTEFHTRRELCPATIANPGTRGALS